MNRGSTAYPDLDTKYIIHRIEIEFKDDGSLLLEDLPGPDGQDSTQESRTPEICKRRRLLGLVRERPFITVGHSE